MNNKNIHEEFDINKENINLIAWLTDSIIHYNQEKKEYEFIAKEEVSEKIEVLLQNKQLESVQDIITKIQESKREVSSKSVSKSFRIDMYAFIKIAYLALKHKTTVNFVLFNILNRKFLEYLKQLETLPNIKQDRINHLRELIQGEVKEKSLKKGKYSRNLYSANFSIAYSYENIRDFVSYDFSKVRNDLIAKLDVNQEDTLKISSAFSKFLKDRLDSISKVIREYLDDTGEIQIKTNDQEIELNLKFEAESLASDLYDELRDSVNASIKYKINQFFRISPENNEVFVDNYFKYSIQLSEDKSGNLLFNKKIITSENYLGIIDKILVADIDFAVNEEELDSRIKQAVSKGEFGTALELTNERILGETRRKFFSWIAREMKSAFNFSQIVSLTLPEDLIILSKAYFKKNTLNDVIHLFKIGEVKFE